MQLKVVILLVLAYVHLKVASEEITGPTDFNATEFSDLQPEEIAEMIQKDWQGYLQPNTSENSREGRTLHLVLVLKKIKLLKLLKAAIILDLHHAFSLLESLNGKTTVRPDPTTMKPGISCQSDNDLIIAVDSSGSVGSHYITELNFTAEIAASWRKHDGNRVAVLIYSHVAQYIFHLEESTMMTAEEIRNAVVKAPHLYSSENLHLAVDAATNEFTTNKREVPRNLLLLTDGRSDISMTRAAAEKFYKVSKTKGFAMGIGKSINVDELRAVAPIPSRLFRVGGFNDLSMIPELISKTICKM